MTRERSIFLVVDSPKEIAQSTAGLLRIHVDTAATDGNQTTILACRLSDYDKIRSWWLQGTTLRRTFGGGL